MNQSSVIGGALIIAYVIYVIYHGELPCWLTMLGIATSATCPRPPTGCAANPTSATGATTPTATNVSVGGSGVSVSFPNTITIGPRTGGGTPPILGGISF